MMDELFLDCYKLALNKKHTLAFITAGGGTGLYQFFQVPGISKVMIEARMLYHPSSFESFLGSKDHKKYVSQEMADLLSLTLSYKSQAEICFTLTCALQTDRARKGKNHGYLSFAQKSLVTHQHYFLIQGETRQEQDFNITHSVLIAVYDYLIQSK